MAQGEDFRLQGGSRPERCTEGVKKRDDEGQHRDAAYWCIAVTSIVTMRTDFLVGTGHVDAAVHVVDVEVSPRAVDGQVAAVDRAEANCTSRGTRIVKSNRTS